MIPNPSSPLPRLCLMRSLRQVCLSLDLVKMCGLETKFHGRSKHEAAHYCGICEFEVGAFFL